LWEWRWLNLAQLDWMKLMAVEWVLTSSNTARYFIIIFNVAGVFFYEYGTCCTFYKSLGTRFIRLTLFAFLKLSLYDLLIIWYRYLIALLLLSIWMQLVDLIHLYLLGQFYFLLLLMLGNNLTKWTIHILMTTTLAIGTWFKILHTLWTWFISLLIHWRVPRRIRTWFPRAIHFVVQWYLWMLRLAIIVLGSLFIVGELGSFLAFTIVRRLHYGLLNWIYNLFNSFISRIIDF